MELYTKPYLNPFVVNVNGKEYCLSNIYAFNSNGIVASNSSGWFGSNNRIRELTLDVDCVLKRKIDLSCKTAFVVKCGDGWDGSRYALYIPADVLKLLPPTYEKRFDGKMIRKTIASGLDDRIYFESNYWLNEKVSAVEHRINELGERIKNLYGKEFNTLPELIQELAEAKKELDERIEEMKNIDIDEYIKTVE